jgi:hypothetical protein
MIASELVFKVTSYVVFLLTWGAGHFRRTDTGNPGPFVVGECPSRPRAQPGLPIAPLDRKDNMKLRVKQSFLVSNSALIQIIAKQKKSQKMGINYS